MSDLRDRILEYALGRTYSRVPGKDLTESIFAAWERGERGSHPDAAQPEAAPPERAATRRGLRLVAASVAAALVGVAAIAAFAYLLGRPEAPTARVLARADAPLPLLRRGEGLVHSNGVLPGDALVVGTEPAELAVGRGGRVSARPASVVGFEERGRDLALVLSSGSLDVEAPGLPGLEADRGEVGVVAVETDFARLELPPGARVAVGLAFDRDSEQPGPDALLAGAAPGLRWLSVSVIAGGARLVHGGRRERVETGSKLRLPSWAPDGPALDPGRERELRALFAQAYPGEAYLSPGPAMIAAEQALAAFFEVVRENPGYLLSVRDAYLAALGDWKIAVAWRREMVLFLLDLGPVGRRIAREAWMQGPELFEPQAVVALAEDGPFEFERELREAVRLGTEDPAERLYYAAALAMRGDAAGRPALLAYMDEGTWSEDDHGPSLLAALALEHLGQSEYWPRVKAAALDAARAALDEGDLKAATDVVLSVAFVAELRTGPDRPRVGLLERRLAAFREERAAALGTAVGVRELLASLR